MRSWLVALVAVGTLHTAHAGYLEATFAHVMRTDEANVGHVVGIALPEGSYYDTAILGSYTHGAEKQWTSAELILLRCGPKTCTPKVIGLGNAEIEVLGLVDLAKPGALPTQRVYMQRTTTARSLDTTKIKRAWPALLVRATTTNQITTKSYTMKDVSGTESRSELAIVSLVAKDAANPRLLWATVEHRYPTGSGAFVSFELVPSEDAKSKTLDLLATEQRRIDNELACIPPAPTKSRYTLDKTRQYRQQLVAVTSGCH